MFEPPTWATPWRRSHISALHRALTSDAASCWPSRIDQWTEPTPWGSCCGRCPALECHRLKRNGATEVSAAVVFRARQRANGRVHTHSVESKCDQKSGVEIFASYLRAWEIWHTQPGPAWQPSSKQWSRDSSSSRCQDQESSWAGSLRSSCDLESKGGKDVM